MSWTWKSTLLGGALASVFIAVFAIQVKRVSSEVQEAQWRDSALRQSALLQRLVSERSQKLKDSFPFTSFSGAGLPAPYTLVVDMELAPGGDVRVRDLRRSEDWALGREETASVLSILRQRDYQADTTYWFLRSSGESSAFTVMAFLGDASGAGFPQQAAGQRLWVAVFHENPLERLVDDFVGSAVEVALQDSLGQVLLDSRISSAEPVGEAGWQVLNSTGMYRTDVPGTNISLTYHVPAESLNFGSAALTGVMVRLGVGILLLGSGLLFWWLKRTPVRGEAEPALNAEQDVKDEATTEDLPPPKVIEVPGPVVRPAEQQVLALAGKLHKHLWALLGPVQHLKGAGLVLEHQKMILQMEENIRPLLEASDSLRSYFKSEDFPVEKLNLSEEARSVLASQAADWASAGVTLVEEIEDDCWVEGSSYAFRKSLNELIKNAMDAMTNSTTKILEVSLFKLDGSVRLRVADSGEGLEEKIQPYAFEPFVGTRSGRMGLGLAFVHGVVEKMGGAAVFDARPTGGAQVLMTFTETKPPLRPLSNVEPVPENSAPLTESLEQMEPPAVESSLGAVEKVELMEDASPLAEDESWGLTTLEENLIPTTENLDGEGEGDFSEQDGDDEEEWSPVFAEVPKSPTGQIRVRSPRRRDLEV